MGLVSRWGFFLKATGLVGGSTFILTASFVGLLSLLSGDPVDLGDRVPFYMIVMGFVFVGTILILEEQGATAEAILVTAIVVAVLAFVGIGLTVEGILFAMRNPDRVFVSQLVYYFIAAGLIATGIGYWGIRHWREFTGQSRGGI